MAEDAEKDQVSEGLHKDVETLLKKLADLRDKKSAQKKASLDFDEELSRIENYVKELEQSVGFALENHREVIADLRGRLTEAAATVKALKEPPWSRATFVRFIRMEGPTETFPGIPLIEVKDVPGNIARVYFMDEETDVHSLKYGQVLLIRGRDGYANHVVETLDECKTEGVVASVVDVLTADHSGARLLVSAREQDTPQVMHTVAGLATDTVKKGSRVLADTASRLVLELLPALETSEGYLVAEVPDVTFGDIGGLDALKQEIEEWLIHPILFPKTSQRMDEPRPKGCVLQGGPGLGKTMLAKAIVNRLHEIRCAHLKLDAALVKPVFYSINGPELLDKFVGESERKIRELFAEARKKSRLGIPVGIFIDEAEALLGIRGSGISSDTEKTIVPMFTSEMQGLEEQGAENIFLILASNLAHSIDAAVKRPGRCDQIFIVPRPDRAGATEIFKKYLRADWRQLHPKYNEDVYTPDSDGKPRKDDSGKEIRYQFGNKAEAARDYLIEHTVARIFDDESRNVVVNISYEGGVGQIVRYHDLISGAIIANVVKRAKRFARVRYTGSLSKLGILHRADELVDLPEQDLRKQGIEPPGVKLKDLYQAVEKVYGEIEVPNDNRAIRHWLLIENLAQGRDVANVSFNRNPNEE